MSAPWPQPLSIRGRVGVAGTFAVAALSLALVSVFLQQLRGWLDHELDLHLRAEAEEFVEAYGQRARSGAFDARLAQELVDAEEGEVGIAVWDAQGRLLAANADLDAALRPPPAPSSGVRYDDAWRADADLPTERRLVWTQPERGGPIGTLVVASSRRHANGLLTSYTRLALILVPGAIALGGFLSWWLAGIALRPLASMVREADTLSAARHDQRLPQPGSGDEVDQLATAMNRALHRMQTAFKALNGFAADASHELRTPLTILRGELDALLAKAETPASQEALESCLAEVDRMTQLVQGLLNLARLDGGVDTEHAVDPAAVFAEVLEDAEVLASEKDLTLVRSRWESLELRANPPLLRQLLWNLVENAIHYTQPGGRITVGVERVHDACQIVVRDTGEGVSPELLERLFEPFFRVRSDAGGFGLGLALVKRIAEVHRGAIAVESTLGAGTTFTVSLPALKDSAAPPLSS
ncbi:MAG: HAMP domain-containing protein [Planctomycetes bacterium]|nr:HAMP domain-containing protein [Planctomycetota bacterium]